MRTESKDRDLRILNTTLGHMSAGRTIHSSLLIENNALSIEQVTAVLDGHQVFAPPKDIRQVQNAYDAYEASGEWDLYSFDDLLAAHGLMMADLVKHPGCLRNGDVGVYAQRAYPSWQSCECSATGDGRPV